MKTLLAILGMTALLAAADGAALYKSQCASCHGMNGEKKALNKSQIIKDFSKEQIVTALKGYKDGSYGGAMKTIMKGQVAKLSDADITAIAEALAAK
jgi:cytochrome c